MGSTPLAPVASTRCLWESRQAGAQRGGVQQTQGQDGGTGRGVGRGGGRGGRLAVRRLTSASPAPFLFRPAPSEGPGYAPPLRAADPARPTPQRHFRHRPHRRGRSRRRRGRRHHRCFPRCRRARHTPSGYPGEPSQTERTIGDHIRRKGRRGTFSATGGSASQARDPGRLPAPRRPLASAWPRHSRTT